MVESNKLIRQLVSKLVSEFLTVDNVVSLFQLVNASISGIIELRFASTGTQHYHG